MDRRYEAYKRLGGVIPPLHDANMDAAMAAHRQTGERDQVSTSIMAEGKRSEFWRAVKAEIDRQVRLEELRFIDRLAPSYEVYLRAWSRRQALIAVLAIPETSNLEHP